MNQIKFSYPFYFVIFLLMLFACQSQAPIATQTSPTAVSTTQSTNIIRLTTGEWPPYVSQDLPYYGLTPRIITAAFALKGITVEYDFFPWARSLKVAQDGQWDGSAVWLKSDEREQSFYYSDPIIEQKGVFFHLKSTDFDWKTVEDLAGFNIGATIDYYYGKPFAEAEEAKQITVDYAPTDEQNFRKLLAGHIDIFPLDLDVGLDILEKNFSPEEIAQITYHPLPLSIDPLYLILSRKNPANVNQIILFNEGLQELKDNGQLQQFIDESRQATNK